MDRHDLLYVFVVILLLSSSIPGAFFSTLESTSLGEEKREITTNKDANNYIHRIEPSFEEKKDDIPYWREYEEPIEHMTTPSTSALDENNESDEFQEKKRFEKEITEVESSLSEGYLEHPPIIIDDDDELADLAYEKGWPGQGTQEDPYLISGYAIDGQGGHSAIYIGNVTEHLTVKDCYLYNATGEESKRPFAAGSTLFNSKNTLLENNTVTQNYRGIDLLDSSDNTVDDNDIFDNTETGILVENGSNNILSNNSIDDNSEGVNLLNSMDSLLFNNTIEENSLGIGIFEDGEGNSIISNHIESNPMGISIHNSNFNKIEKNTVSNGQTGIEISGSSRNYIIDNIILYTPNGGIILKNSDTTVIEKNSMQSCGLIIEGHLMPHYDSHIIDSENMVNGADLYYLKNQTGETITGSVGQVILVNTTDTDINGIDVNDAGRGIHLAYSHNNSISYIESSFNNRQGIFLEESHFNHIDNSSFQDNLEGISIEDSEHNIFYNNTVSNNRGGFVLSNSPQNQMVNNTVQSNQNGVDIWSSDNTGLFNNFIVDNSRYGIILSSSRFNVLEDNSLQGHGVFIDGTLKEYWNTHTMEVSNTVNGHPLRYYKNEANTQVPSDSGQVILANSSDMTIIDQNIGGVCAAILLGFSDNNEISNVSINRNTFFGIRLENSNDNKIGDSFLEDGSDGINIRNSMDNLLFNTTIKKHSRAIIMWQSSQDNEVTESKIVQNRHGIYLYNTDNISVKSSNISYNDNSGITISSSKDDSVTDNFFLNNGRDGVFLSSSLRTNLSNNTFETGGVRIGGRDILHWNTHTIDISNRVNESPIHYFKNETEGQVPSDAGQVILANSTGISVQDLDINNVSIGILIGFSDQNDIINNRLSDNYYSGLRAEFSIGNYIENNIFVGNDEGIILRNSEANEFVGNELSDNNRAIYLYLSEFNVIENNTIDDHTRSVLIFLSDHNEMYYNTITKSQDYSISLRHSDENLIATNNILKSKGSGILLYSSHENEIQKNEIYLNKNGVKLEYSYGNTITKNELTNNEIGIYFDGSDQNILNNNNLLDNIEGIRLYYSRDNILRDNLLNKEDFGIDNKSNSNMIADYEPGTVLVKLNTNYLERKNSEKLTRVTLEEKGNKLSNEVMGRTSRIFSAVNGFEIKLDSDIEINEAIDRLSKMPEVSYAEPNYYYNLLSDLEPSNLPNDPGYDSLWGMDKISAPGAWNETTGSEDVVIAVVDTGIDYTHEDLTDNMWEDENGYHGYNAVNDSYYPMDGHGHGTHVAGTIGAVGDNEVGVVGVNWNVSLMALKMFDDSGSATTTQAIECLEFVLEMKREGENIVATSNSWGGGAYSQLLRDIIEEHRDEGISFVAAAGNDGENNDLNPIYPSSYSLTNIISVAATDQSDELASFSNYGENSVHVAAPGVHINSTWRNDGYRRLSGTSMATPHVSGLIGLLASHYPSYDHNDLKNIVLSSSDQLDNLENMLLTHGRINASKAIEASTQPEPYFWIHRPTNKSELSVITETEIMISLTDGVDPILGADVEVEFSSGEGPIILKDEGTGSDEEGDGYYTAMWFPSSYGEITLEITAQIDSWQETKEVTVTVFGGSTGISIIRSDDNELMGNHVAWTDNRALYFQDSENNEIINNNISDNRGNGVYLYGSDKNAIVDNVISYNEVDGAYLWDSHHNHLYNNTLYSNTNYGLNLQYSRYNEIVNSGFESNLRGISMYSSSNNTIQYSDLSNNEQYGILLRESSIQNKVTSNEINSNVVKGIFIQSSSHNNSIVNNKLMENSIGQNNYALRVWNSDNITLEDNYLSKNERGIFIRYSDNNNLRDNIIEDNFGKGIYLSQSNENTFYNNIILSNEGYGIDLSNSDSNHIQINNVSNNTRGISISSNSNYNTIMNNSITHNSGHGIYSSTYGNTFKGNEISNNQRKGMYVSSSHNNLILGNELRLNIEEALYILNTENNLIRGNTLIQNEDYAIYLSGSVNNNIYHNNFIENEYQAYDDSDNTWNASYHLGGNHWSDHEGPDEYQGEYQNLTGSDGIIDVPYEGETFTDKYPLKEPAPMPHVRIDNPEEEDVVTRNYAQVEWTAMYRFSDALEFFVRIDDEWIEVGNETEYTFQNLSCGEYTVEVKAIDENGNIGINNVSFIVEYEVDEIVISPSDDIIEAGDEQVFTAKAYDEGGEMTGDITLTVEWSIQDGAGGYWDYNVYHSEFKGEWIVTASYDGVENTTSLTVTPSNVYEVSIEPSKHQNVSAGEELQFSAVAYDEFGNLITQDAEEFTWKNTTDEGIFNETVIGDYKVTAIYQGVLSKPVNVTVVVDEVFMVNIEPITDQNIKAGDIIEFSATAYDRYGNLITDENTDFTWYNTDGQGVFDKTSVGGYMVTATYENVESESVTVTVDPAEVDTVVNKPSTHQSVSAGEELQFSAVAYDEFGNLITQDAEEFTWKNTTDEGMFNETAIGDYKVTAIYQGVSSKPVNVTVVVDEVFMVNIEPITDQTIKAGDIIEFTATAYDGYQNQVTDNNTEFIWKNTDETGLFEETTAGEYTVTATYDDITSDTITVNVKPGEIADFSINVGDIYVGENPILEVFETVDGYDNLIEGDNSITISIDDDTATETLTFTDGNALYTLNEFDEDGVYTVTVTIGDINRLGTFSVNNIVKPAEFEVSNLRVDKDEVGFGEETTFLIDVTNVGDELDDYTVDFYVDGEYIGSTTVTVEGGQTVTASITHILEEYGEHEVSAGEERVNVIVKEESYPPLTAKWILTQISIIIISIISVLLYKCRSD